MHPNSIDPDDGPRPKYWPNTIEYFIAIEGTAWVEAKKDVLFIPLIETITFLNVVDFSV